MQICHWSYENFTTCHDPANIVMCSMNNIISAFGIICPRFTHEDVCSLSTQFYNGELDGETFFYDLLLPPPRHRGEKVFVQVLILKRPTPDRKTVQKASRFGRGV